MTGQQLLSLLMFRLGHRTNAVVRSAAELEMQLMQQTMEGEAFKPWFLFDDDYTDAGFVTAADVDYVALPTGYLGLDDDFCELAYKDTTIDATRDQWRTMERDVWGDIKAYFFSEDRATPQRWDIQGSRIYLRPIPDAVYELRLPHYRAATLVTDADVSNAWTTYAGDWLLARTLEQVAVKHVGDKDLAMMCAADVQTARLRVYREHEQRAHTGRRYSMGDD